MAISLKSIARGPRLKPPKVVAYGTGGIGKTSFAADAPNPIFLMTEEGQGTLDIQRFEPRAGSPVLRSWQEILDCVTALYHEPHDFQTVVLDTVDFAEPLLHAHTANRHGKPDIEAFGFGKGFNFAVDEFRVLLAGLDALRDDRGMVVLLLAHCHIRRFESPDSDSYDRYRLRLNEKLAEVVHDWSDAVLFFNFRSAVVKESAGFGKDRKRAVGMGERVIYTEARPAWVAKNRYSLPPELPLLKDHPWMVFQNAIAASQAAILPSAPEEEVAAPAVAAPAAK